MRLFYIRIIVRVLSLGVCRLYDFCFGAIILWCPCINSHIVVNFLVVHCILVFRFIFINVVHFILVVFLQLIIFGHLVGCVIHRHILIGALGVKWNGAFRAVIIIIDRRYFALNTNFPPAGFVGHHGQCTRGTWLVQHRPTILRTRSNFRFHPVHGFVAVCHRNG